MFMTNPQGAFCMRMAGPQEAEAIQKHCSTDFFSCNLPKRIVFEGKWRNLRVSSRPLAEPSQFVLVFLYVH